MAPRAKVFGASARQQACRAADRTRGTAHERGYDRQWSKAAKQYLSSNPLCVACISQEQTTAATCVDHVRPHRGDQSLFWDVANWQSLCNACHARKTRRGE